MALVTYRITVTTRNVDSAGTDANVYITMFGDNGNSGERQVDNEEDNFEKGKVDTFSIVMDDIGEINTVRIRHDNKGDHPGWFLENITINNEVTDTVRVFPCDRWLARDEDDRLIDRFLDRR